MNMSWLESIIYGLVSGFSEFLPISSHAHQTILMQLFGSHARDPVRDLLVHMAILIGLYSGCKPVIEHLRREQNSASRRRREYGRSTRSQLDARFVKNTAIVMLIGILVITYVFNPVSNLLTAAAFLLINGIILFASGRMMQGNKDVRSMTYLDSLLMGVIASLSAFSGVSRVGCVTSVAIARGADRQNSLNWAFLISIPALLLLMVIDVVQIFAGDVAINFWGSFFTYLLSASAAYLGGLYSIKFMRFLTVRVGFSGFSYYCWGASLFSFLLYLTVA